MSFTPGPWRTGWLQSFDAFTGEAEAFVYRRDPDDERETADSRICVRGGDDPVADARLIAAAPDLLEALRNLVGLARVAGPRLHQYEAALADAATAIAKAEGR